MTVQPLIVILATVLALVPIIIWLWILAKETNRDRFRGLITIFIIGAFSVVPILYLQRVWTLHPDLNPIGWIEGLVTQPYLVLIITFVAFGIIEELVKARAVMFANTNLFKIKDVSTAIKFSLIVGLGFSFTENITYFYTTLVSTNNIFVIFMTVFLRATISTLGHMTFSGVFGYFYGLAKFAKPFLEEEEWLGKHFHFAGMLHKISGIEKANLVGQQKIGTGLMMASLMHAVFNILLEKNALLPAIALILTGALYIILLLRKQSIHLPLTADIVLPSLMKKKDEEVVLELLGMWYREKKYQDVIEICDRLLKKDPSNPVIKLFRAHALEQKKFAHLKKDIQALFTKEEVKADDLDTGVIEKLKKDTTRSKSA